MIDRWLRGNLHAHTTLSDGKQRPEELIAAYQKRGYDFLAMTDHDLLAPVEDYQSGTLMLLIPGTEVTAHGPHLCATGIRECIAPDADRQQAIDNGRAQEAIVVLNHPNWGEQYNHWPQEEMERLTGYDGIEIFNGVVQFLEGESLATDRWDRLLSAGRRVWGFANDDTHSADGVAHGWNTVRHMAGEAVTWPALRDAMRRGDFYASTGVSLRDIVWQDNTLRVVSENADRIRFFGKYGRMLASIDAPEASFTPTGPERYIRAEAYGPRGSTAWTQPVFP